MASFSFRSKSTQAVVVEVVAGLRHLAVAAVVDLRSTSEASHLRVRPAPVEAMSTTRWQKRAPLSAQSLSQARPRQLSPRLTLIFAKDAST